MRNNYGDISYLFISVLSDFKKRFGLLNYFMFIFSKFIKYNVYPHLEYILFVTHLLLYLSVEYDFKFYQLFKSYFKRMRLFIY